ncbi:type I restriction enzyme specificity protein (plasmid) [Lactococcus cremoris subsp. cremoris UC509.9]|uniref:restriction endonuclease subunit S n=1 Tax=Lactococcus lactis subsp. cremoris TaxID=1359 RepID=UPI00029B7975|nr:type I restriction enzyme specificity protein [Lactococcus cremoris subsp. cremoris UC509.9]
MVGTMAKIDDSVKKKVPELRFPGFTDDWEERKLGELTTSFSGGTPSAGNSSYYKGDIPFIRSGEINSDKTELFLTEAGLKSSSAKMVSVGDILYALYGATSGEVGISQINGAINQAILAIKPCDGYNSHFLMQWLKLKKQKIIDQYLQGGQGNLSGSIVKNLVLKVPNFEEQKKIGAFFKQLDDTITLHQRKLDLLKEQKKGYLQKMFPKNGAKVPELRFAGFADDWEERKLGDLLKEFSIKSKIEDEHKVLSSTNSGMEFREGRVSGTSNLGYKIIKNGDLVLSPQNLWLGNININNIGKGLVSPSYKTFEFINIDSSFINPQLRTQKMLEEYKNSSTQGASVVRRNLEIDSFYQIKIFVPTISEQEKIGSFFKQLDDTIDLHQRKLDLLKEQKKGFLQKMFV